MVDRTDAICGERERYVATGAQSAPAARVSRDGSLGWVIVQVRARGLQTTATGSTEVLEFTSAWIELYEKRDGRWLRIGNVSNFKS